MFKKYSMAHEVAGLAEIDARGVQADRPHLSIFGQPSSRLRVQAGKMKLGHGFRASFIGSHIFNAIRPKTIISGIEK